MEYFFECATVARLLELPWRGCFRCRGAAASAVDCAADRRASLERIGSQAQLREGKPCVCLCVHSASQRNAWAVSA